MSNENIYFTEQGIFICVEMVGEINEDGTVKDILNHRPSLVFTDKDCDEFQSTTFHKGKFDDQWIKIDKNKIHLDKELFLALKLTIQSYVK